MSEKFFYWDWIVLKYTLVFRYSRLREEIVNDLQVEKVKNEFKWNLVINVGVAALLLID